MRKWMTFMIAVAGCITMAQAEVRIVVNTGAGIDTIDAKTVENLFLGRKKELPNGTKAVPVTLSEGAVHEEFLAGFVSRSSSQFKSHWKKAVFTGQGQPPKEVKTEAELIEYVAATPGAIGYVGASADVSKVKVVAKK